MGLKREGVYGDAPFSLNALSYRQQMPSLHFRPNPDPALAGLSAFDGVFDIQAQHCTTGQFKGIVDPKLSPPDKFSVQNMRASGR